MCASPFSGSDAVLKARLVKDVSDALGEVPDGNPTSHVLDVLAYLQFDSAL